jgi:hypothetical protein
MPDRDVRVVEIVCRVCVIPSFSITRRDGALATAVSATMSSNFRTWNPNVNAARAASVAYP